MKCPLFCFLLSSADGDLVYSGGRGCVVLERPDLVKELVLKHHARDTTARGTAMAELEAMTPRFSQWLPGQEIPETHWMYRLAKRYWFNDFNAYALAAHDPTAAAKANELVGRNLSSTRALAQPILPGVNDPT